MTVESESDMKVETDVKDEQLHELDYNSALSMILPLGIPTDILCQLQQFDVPPLLPNQSMNVTPSLLLEKPKNLTADERRQRRLWRNRMAAKECRKKKKQYIGQLEATIERLQSENALLRKEAEDLRQKVAGIKECSFDENYQLMKEVEQLNAKLGMK
ncbi:hypothetical protein BD560DRAFT_390189 [Blakeslea trispora]|nr:hypothetical protein BD560DRAFT_390189 [Blakeslea trispora]